jgi:hypothetical protein
MCIARVWLLIVPRWVALLRSDVDLSEVGPGRRVFPHCGFVLERMCPAGPFFFHSLCFLADEVNGSVLSYVPIMMYCCVIGPEIGAN